MVPAGCIFSVSSSFDSVRPSQEKAVGGWRQGEVRGILLLLLSAAESIAVSVAFLVHEGEVTQDLLSSHSMFITQGLM